MKGPKVTLEKIEQDIDLDEFFPGVDFSDERALKEAIGQDIIDKIVSRTEAGGGIKISANGQGRPVKLKAPYSKQYVDSLEFKAAGKQKAKVNMTLTGDMLAAIDVVSTTGNKIKIGITDDDQIPKAYNHQTGDTVPERPFFGISKSELKEILDDYRDNIKALKTEDEDAKAERQGSESETLSVADFLGDAYDDYYDGED